MKSTVSLANVKSTPLAVACDVGISGTVHIDAVDGIPSVMIESAPKETSKALKARGALASSHNAISREDERSAYREAVEMRHTGVFRR